ncbi:MAG: hypothetical protein AAGD11_05090 [Planctomycetota bacterium]
MLQSKTVDAVVSSRVGLILILGLSGISGNVSAESHENEKLPVERIVLFNSGVGYFEHRGQVEGDDQVELSFKTDDINDLLKSLVLQDLGGGRISTVSYGSRDPINKTLQTFAIDLTKQPTLFDLLVQVRGQELIVQAPSELRGIMVGAESRPQAVPGGEPIKADYITLLTEDGLQSVAMSSIRQLKMADTELQQELRAALQTLASAHATDKKTVTLDFLGDGTRAVRVGYIREAPVWKTSYRLVLRDEKAPLLQGWAIVENTGDLDWRNVELSLVSGRPISFEMDLYSPLYASRPQVAHELYSALQPQEYQQAIARAQLAESTPALAGRMLSRRSKQQRGMGGGGGGGAFGGYGGGAGEFGGEYGAPASAVPSNDDPFGDFSKEVEFDIAAGVDAMAEGGDVGELFRYDIDTPVTLARQRSAMLPIVNQTVEANKLSIYNRTVHIKYPLNGIRLKNTSNLHLMQGPITLFDGGVYAGDGRIAALPPGEERLVSYAMDLDVEVMPSAKASSNRLTSVKIVNGMLQAQQNYLRTWSYAIKNSSDQEKSVLIEHPIDARWKLAGDNVPDETTRSHYRFAADIEPGHTTQLAIEERRTGTQVINLQNSNDSRYAFYIKAQEVDDEVKQALLDYQRRRSAVMELTRQLDDRKSQLTTIDKEQARIRQNMQQLPQESDLYRRYIKKFTEQEDKVEQLNAEMRELQEEIIVKENELRTALEGLNIG